MSIEFDVLLANKMWYLVLRHLVLILLDAVVYKVKQKAGSSLESSICCIRFLSTIKHQL